MLHRLWNLFSHMAPTHYSFMGLVFQLHQFIGGVCDYNDYLSLGTKHISYFTKVKVNEEGKKIQEDE